MLNVISYRLGRHCCCFVFCFFRRSAQVWENDRLFMIPELVVWEVRDIPSVASVKELLHGDAINKLATSKVQEDRILFEVSDNIRPNDAVGTAILRGTFDVRNIETDVIGRGTGRCNRVGENGISRQFQRRFDRKARIIS